jgi:hypothetical protein
LWIVVSLWIVGRGDRQIRRAIVIEVSYRHVGKACPVGKRN